MFSISKQTESTKQPTIPPTMRAVLKAKAAPGLTMVDDYPVPQIGPGEVLVKVRAASICGTDLHIYKWDEWAASRIHPPVVIGHEITGDVVQVAPDVQRVKVGDFVSLESHVICNVCEFCRTGRGHICENTQIIGVDRDGGFAEYMAIPAQNAWVNPPEMPDTISVLMENFGNSVHTALAQSCAGKNVLLTGCGPVGCMAVAVAKAAGARAIWASDISPYRLELAQRMGADYTVNPLEEDIVTRIMKDTQGEGIDILLEMSGAPSAIDQGFHLLKSDGEVAILGLTAKPVVFDINNHITFKAATVRGIAGRRLWQTWFQMSALLHSGKVDLGPMVTHEFTLAEFDLAFETFASGSSGKVMLRP
jgi:threonine 3-dehydrogenase